MPANDSSFFAPLREAYEASRRVRTPEDLAAVLEGIAELVGDQLGWGAVVLNVHRRAWDDFEAAVVRGPDASRRALLGTSQSWPQWAPLFRERFERRGAYFVPAEAGEDPDVVLFIPDMAVPATAQGWHPHDMLLVLMRGGDGEVAGILSVDAPRSGRRPTDSDIDALVAVANAAGTALQQAREAADSARHQSALQQLLAVSAKLADARSDADVLDTVCDGIRDALGFERVAVELADATGALVPRAWTGWDVAPDVPLQIDHFAKILRPEYEEHGCYLLDRVDALRILSLPDSPYESLHNGRGPWAWSRHWLAVPLRDPDGVLTGFIWADEPADRLLPDTPRLQALRLFADQAQATLEAARHYEQAVYLAAHDSLTELPNRAVFLERLRHALLRTRRGDRTLAVLFVDIDRFKTVNDTHGHDAGDAVLRAVAARIDGALRPGDTVARLGGDEFVVLCEDIRGERDALEVAQRIRELLAEPITVGTSVISLTASVGLALPDGAAENAQELLRFADVAMYRAKSAGRDGEQIASRAVRADASARAQLERALSGALERGEIHLHWQPIVSVPTGRVLRAEALMRWNHPELGPVSPLEFIPLAEDNGSIIALGRWALDRACAQWAQWRAELGESSPAVAVNLSPRQLRDARLLDQIAWLIDQHQMPEGALTVEITEGALLDATPSAIQTLAGLRSLGCSIELDDFGTGFSSLSLLAEFHVDGLKIDRSFVSGHDGGDSRGATIAQAVLAMAGALGLHATAEGVETAAQLEWLRSRGCKEAQGYLFSRPVPADELTRQLAAGEPLPAAPPAAASTP